MCHWCSSSKCLPNTVDYNNEPVDGDANNCFVQDQECRYKTANVTSNSLCELTVSTQFDFPFMRSYCGLIVHRCISHGRELTVLGLIW